jgi:two-component system LytT family response regulator
MERMIIKTGKNYRFIHVDHIQWVEADGNYLRVYIGDQSHLIRETLGNLEKKLDGDRFIRINRSTIVNIECIKELRALKYSKYLVVLENDRSWVWGQTFNDSLRRIKSGAY